MAHENLQMNNVASSSSYMLMQGKNAASNKVTSININQNLKYSNSKS